MKDLARLRLRIERARRKLYNTYKEGMPGDILRASRAVDRLLNDYEDLKGKVGA